MTTLIGRRRSITTPHESAQENNYKPLEEGLQYNEIDLSDDVGEIDLKDAKEER